MFCSFLLTAHLGHVCYASRTRNNAQLDSRDVEFCAKEFTETAFNNLSGVLAGAAALTFNFSLLDCQTSCRGAAKVAERYPQT